MRPCPKFFALWAKLSGQVKKGPATRDSLPAPGRSRGTVLRCSAALGGGLYPIGRTFLSGKKGVPHKEEAFFIAFIFGPFPMPKPLLPAVLARLPDGFGGKLHSCAKRVAFSPYWRPDEAYSPAPP